MVEEEVGYVYAVCGAESFLREAVTSATSLKRVDDEAHVTLITTPSLAGEGRAAPPFDHVVEVGDEIVDGHEVDWQTGLSFKAATIYEHSPYERTLFLDSDTYVIDNCRGLFGLLDHFELCLPKVPGASNPFMKDGNEVVGYNSYSSGLILFKKGRENEALFADWRNAFENGDFWGDQRALTHVLLGNEVAPYVLPNNWHAVFGSFENYSGRVHLLHGRHHDLPYIAERINVTTAGRVWVPPIESCIHRGMDVGEILRLVANTGKGIKRKVYGYLGWRDDPQYRTAATRDTSLQ
jgi:hypothetical protein